MTGHLFPLHICPGLFRTLESRALQTPARGDGVVVAGKVHAGRASLLYVFFRPTRVLGTLGVFGRPYRAGTDSTSRSTTGETERGCTPRICNLH